MDTLQVLLQAELYLQAPRAVVAASRYLPSEVGHKVDVLRIGLEVDEQLGLLRRADAGEVPQATTSRPDTGLHKEISARPSTGRVSWGGHG